MAVFTILQLAFKPKGAIDKVRGCGKPLSIAVQSVHAKLLQPRVAQASNTASQRINRKPHADGFTPAEMGFEQ